MNDFLKTHIILTHPSGQAVQFPAHLVADSRARYYADMDAGGDSARHDELYNEEYRAAMQDEDLLLEWVQNNMDWVDVKDHAVLVKTPDIPDMQTVWFDSENFRVKST